MEEIYGEKLIPEADWINIIGALKPLKELTEPEDKISSEVKRLAEDAVKQRIENDDRIGIFFSGGLDSSLIAAICKKFNAKFTCYTVGVQDGNMEYPEDVKYAKEVAKHLKLSDDEFKYKIFNIDEADKIIVDTIKNLKVHGLASSSGEINASVNVGVGAVVTAAYSISNKESCFFSGLGSEELFAGYERHKNNPTNDECYEGLLKMYKRDLLRDSTISQALRFKFLTPFLDEKLINYSLSIPIKYKISKDGNKMILRKAAMSYLGDYANRPKKAAQYGSSFDKALLKIAKNHGFKTRSGYIDSI